MSKQTTRTDPDRLAPGMDQNNYSYGGIMVNQNQAKDEPKFKHCKWTRVITVGVSTPSTVSFTDLQVEFDENEADPLEPRKAQKKPWELIFDPELFLEEHGELYLADFHLSQDTLKQYAVLCSRIRSGFRDKALQMSRVEAAQSKDEDSAISRLAKTVEKNHHKARGRITKLIKKEVTDLTPIGLRRKNKHRARLTTNEKLEIADRIIRGCEPTADLAKEYRVTYSCISQLVCKIRKKPNVLEEQINKGFERATLDEKLAIFVDIKLLNGEVIERADDVRRDFEAATGVSLKVHRVRWVMRDLLDLRYTKIVQLPVHGNSERCLVQRQQCAIIFLKHIQVKKRIINIDESWLDSGDYRRMSWQRKGTSNGIPVKKVQPRITLMVALDTEGKIYASLLQANSDADTMVLFLKELIKTLDYEDKYWRSNSIIMWDNATYHGAKEVLTLLKEQRAPILFLGPYSYHMAPVEMVFGALKVQQLNTEEAPLGKKSFGNVVGMALRGLSNIPKARLLLMWSHIVLCTYRYLMFERL